MYLKRANQPDLHQLQRTEAMGKEVGEKTLNLPTWAGSKDGVWLAGKSLKGRCLPEPSMSFLTLASFVLGHRGFPLSGFSPTLS